jgi:hydrogenase maturation protease
MTTALVARRALAATGGRPQIAVEVLLCGSRNAGDDGVPLAVGPLIAKRLPADVRVKAVGTLDIDALLAVPSGAATVIVDSAVGIEPGAIVSIPLNGLIGHEGLRARSSHALAFPEVIGLAELMRGVPLSGRIVMIGATRFGPGKPVSKRVGLAFPELIRATLEAVDLVRPSTGPVGRL